MYRNRILQTTSLVAALCLAGSTPRLEAQSGPGADGTSPSTPLTIRSISGDEQGVNIELEWGDAALGAVAVTFSNAEGTALGSAVAGGGKGGTAVVAVPVDRTGDEGQGFSFSVDVHSGERLIASSGVELDLDCPTDGGTCQGLYRLTGTRSNAIAVSRRLGEALGTAEELGLSRGGSNLVDAVSEIDPALRGEAIRYSSDLYELLFHHDGCDCFWARNGAEGEKLPDTLTPASLQGGGPDTQVVVSDQGPGAVLRVILSHLSNPGGAYEFATLTAQGSTYREIWIDCREVTEWVSIWVPVDVNGDGIPDYEILLPVPVAWGPCVDPDCEPQVDVLGVATAFSFASANDNDPSPVAPEGHSTARADVNVQGTQLVARDSESLNAFFDFGTNSAQTVTQVPVSIVSQAYGRSRSRATGADTTFVTAASSGSYAAFGQDQCASEGQPMFIFDQGGAAGLVTHHCPEIVDFYNAQGLNVACP